ncbi:AAA family ATPase [Brevundimonas sp. TWP1-2-1b1]|uniref:AAA family ATPase n=1 Tax=unclassified Brevundimonas TaxID=2622653 RepID=UPI003CFB24CF
MQVIYRGRSIARWPSQVPEGDGDVLELLENNWDDFGNKTTFGTICRVGGETVELGSIRLMVEGQLTTATYFDQRRGAGWNGVFPLPEANYLSVPNEITFYEQLVSVLGAGVAITVATALRDASLLINTNQDPRAVALIGTSAFRSSLQRERGSEKAFLDGWMVFQRETMAVLDLGFHFRDVYGATSLLELKFQPDTPFPHDVNVLIGANGAGKSQILHQIVGAWIDETGVEGIGFARKPNLSQLVVVSYSPFEMFPVDLQDTKLLDKSIYRYFGLRGRSRSADPTQPDELRLSYSVPKRDAAGSVLDCMADDQRFKRISGWSSKLETMQQVLRTAFDFDFVAVRVDGEPDAMSHLAGVLPADTQITITGPRYAGYYAAVRSVDMDDYSVSAVRDRYIPEQGVFFFKDGAPVELSSGQKLFSFIVINILGAIRRESLLLIDEPELFLHPALEIQFLGMLKRILFRFNSKALLATHSEVTVREVPSACVHVLTRTDDGLVVHKPPFQTFGGDVQRISSYVFSDNTTSKPFERWILDQLDNFHGAEALIEALGDQINEELIIQIRAQERLKRDANPLWL